MQTADSQLAARESLSVRSEVAVGCRGEERSCRQLSEPQGNLEVTNADLAILLEWC